MINTKLKKNDLVKILTGKDKGKTGRVLVLDRAKGRVIVEGCNMKKKTVRPKSSQEKGGIIEIEGPLDVSNVMLIDGKGDTTRIGYRFEKDAKVRFAKKSGEVI